MPTKTDATGRLSAKQCNAIGLLLAGKTDSEAAKEVGVTRQTMNGWRNHNARFVAELNRRREEVWRAGIERLRSLVGEAIGVLESGLHADDERVRIQTAVHVLKSLGLYGVDHEPRGLTAEEEVSEAWARFEYESKFDIRPVKIAPLDNYSQ
jgi:hypothetical protein